MGGSFENASREETGQTKDHATAATLLNEMCGDTPDKAQTTLILQARYYSCRAEAGAFE